MNFDSINENIPNVEVEGTFTASESASRLSLVGTVLQGPPDFVGATIPVGVDFTFSVGEFTEFTIAIAAADVQNVNDAFGTSFFGDTTFTFRLVE